MSNEEEPIRIYVAEELKRPPVNPMELPYLGLLDEYGRFDSGRHNAEREAARRAALSVTADADFPRLWSHLIGNETLYDLRVTDDYQTNLAQQTTDEFQQLADRFWFQDYDSAHTPLLVGNDPTWNGDILRFRGWGRKARYCVWRRLNESVPALRIYERQEDDEDYTLTTIFRCWQYYAFTTPYLHIETKKNKLTHAPVSNYRTISYLSDMRPLRSIQRTWWPDL